MSLGDRLRQARLEKGLSQRQLCGDRITRNMLSQIENGSAHPSMDTLRYLSARLEMPMGYFLEEQAVTSPNQEVMAAAKAADRAETLRILENYRAPDAVFDAERYLLEVLACLSLAEQALTEKKNAYAATLLAQAAQAGEKTPYYTDGLRRKQLLLCYQAAPDRAASLADALPDNLQELLLRAEASLQAGQPARCIAILQAAQTQPPQWLLLKAQAHMALEEYAPAAELFCRIETVYPQQAYAALETCYRLLEDYKMAYHYACLRR